MKTKIILLTLIVIATSLSSCKKKCQECVITSTTYNVPHNSNVTLIDESRRVVKDCEFELQEVTITERYYPNIMLSNYNETITIIKCDKI